MSINNLELSPETVRILYRSSLVANTEALTPAEELPANEKEKNIEIKKLGKNKKKIVFVVNNPKNTFADDEEMTLITNLLNACDLSLDDIALINYDKNKDATNRHINESFRPKIEIVFGVSCAQLQLPFNVPYFQTYEFDNCTYLFNPPLREFLSNSTLKRNLWQCLKTIFAV